MAKILLRTTIPFADDDWNAGRFCMLKSELEKAGNEVTARNREAGEKGDDPVLSGLRDAGYDQLRLMAVDAGNGLPHNDVPTARDHGNLGACITELGALGRLGIFKDSVRNIARWLS